MPNPKNSAFKSKPMIPMDTMSGESNSKAFRLKEKARRGLGLTPRQLIIKTEIQLE